MPAATSGMGCNSLTQPVTIATLFAGKTAAEWRALYRDAYDWGPDCGREVVPD